MLELIQYVSIIIELIIAIIGLLIVFQKKKTYGWGIFVTFGIYVFYDLSKMISFSINPDLLYGLFFIASLSALWFVIMIFKEKRGSKKWNP